jgi:hypothetical protein
MEPSSRHPDTWVCFLVDSRMPRAVGLMIPLADNPHRRRRHHPTWLWRTALLDELCGFCAVVRQGCHC